MGSLSAQLLIGVVSILAMAGMIVSLPIKIDKSGWALLGGIATWIIAALFVDHETYQSMTRPAVFDILSVIIFLFAAMTIVEGVDYHGGFSVITRYITATNKDKLLVIVSIITFFLSALLDNLTTSIVMGSLVVKLMKSMNNRLIFASVVVATANIGGVFSPIGNTTSILLWVGKQMTATGMITMLFLPSLVALSVIIMWFTIKMSGNVSKPDLDEFAVTEEHLVLPLPEKAMILGLGITSLLIAPICKIMLQMEPWEGMIAGLVFYQVGTGIFHWRKGTSFQNHYNIRSILKHVDTSTLYFFTGILMMVATNAKFGNLQFLADGLDTIAGNFPSEYSSWLITGIIGLVSGIIPNTPIVAAAQQMYIDVALYPQDGLFWQLLTYTSGVGGSLFILGSASGVVMMAIHKELTFGVYAKIMTVPSLLSFVAGFGAIYLQYLILQ